MKRLWKRATGLGTTLNPEQEFRVRSINFQVSRVLPVETPAAACEVVLGVPDVCLRTARLCRAQNIGEFAVDLPARGPELAGVRAGLPILDIFSRGTYRVGYFKAKITRFFGWHLLCVLHAFPCTPSASFCSPELFLTPAEPLEWPTGDFQCQHEIARRSGRREGA